MSLTESEIEQILTRVAETGQDVKIYVDQRLAQIRTPSKAGLATGRGSDPFTYSSAIDPNAGRFLLAVMQASSRDADEQAKGKATLTELSYYEEAYGKASLGTTDATGGWIIPNALVDDISKVGQAKNIYRQLMTIRPGVTAFAIDLPFRAAAPARALVSTFGQTKENVDLAYNGYTATMYTLARIHDVGNQFLRQSAGAAEADVMGELAHAFALGERFYIREGTNSSQPYGFQKVFTDYSAALTTAGFITTHTAAAATVAGSVSRAIAAAGSALLGRNRTPEAAVMSATGFSEMLTNGADTAGFFLSGISGPQAVPGLKPGTLVSPWGIPVYVDPDLASDDLYVAEWSAFKVYFGQNFRVESSSVAGTRWDTNLTGFRGEEEMAFDARPAILAGAMQQVTDILS